MIQNFLKTTHVKAFLFVVLLLPQNLFGDDTASKVAEKPNAGLTQTSKYKNMPLTYLKAKPLASPPREFSLINLKKHLKAETVTFFDPHYQKQMSFRAFALHPLLDHIFGASWRKKKYKDKHFVFTARDGYQSNGTWSLIKKEGGFVAFELSDGSPLPKVGREKSRVAPFYLFWKGKRQTTEHRYPWPWNIRTISMVDFKKKFSALNLDERFVGQALLSQAKRGQKIFRGRCVRCHSLSGVGGKIGPDLGAPQNVLSYRSPKEVLEMIQNPKAFRHSKMPAHPDIKGKKADALMLYLEAMKNASRYKK